MSEISFIDATTLANWLETGKKVSIVDVRPINESSEWSIPQSIHVDAYNKLKRRDQTAFNGMHLDKSIPVVTVCARGNTSRIAAEFLQKDGYEVYSLIGGMMGWNLIWNKAEVSFANYQIIQLRRTGKGCLSYIIVSNNEALVLDASLPVDAYEKILLENNWKLKAVMETHIHVDHLSRSKELSDRLTVPLLLPDSNKLQFAFDRIKEGQIIDLGKTSIKVIATPGHTMESVSFLVNDEVLLTGDTIFANAIGRPDLKANEEEAQQRAGLLYDSLQKIMQLDESIILLPGHTNLPADFDGKLIKASISEVKNNMAVLRLPKSVFVRTILDKLPPPPANHLIIAEKNLTGNISDVNAVDIEAGANRCAVA
jgi:glyoxylase-like metal-dependent hydrolase (beta-lactamase superfamily II)/rhodanese-related sulfurtransferase